MPAPKTGVMVFPRLNGLIGLYRGDGTWAALSTTGQPEPGQDVCELLTEHFGSRDRFEVVRRGKSVRIQAGNQERHVQPYLVDVTKPPTTAELDWRDPTRVLGLRTAPGLWRAYRRVGPRIDTVRSDREHGASYLSLRALEALRDEAASLVYRADPGGDGVSGLRTTARALASCRPEMVVIGNRIDRVMANARGADARLLLDRCRTVHRAARSADDRAAIHAAKHCAARRVLTISRSETVIRAIETGPPEHVWIVESRPDREGVDVARQLASDVSVTVTIDAAVGHVLERKEIDLVMVGADAIGPTGSLKNKVGTGTVAHVANSLGIPVLVVTAADKITYETITPGPPGDTAAVATGDGRFTVSYPLFDVIAGDLVDRIVTERGELDPAGCSSLAKACRERRSWRAGNR